MMKFAFLLSFITGVKVGCEFYEVEGVKHLALDLFIINLVICWGDLEQLELEE